MGSRDHRAHAAPPLAPAAADAQAAALDVPDGPVHATDQEAARQARLGPAAPAAGDAGVLQGEQDQPARVGPAGAGAAAGLPLAVLHAAHRPAARHLPGHQPSRHVEPTAVRRDGGFALPLHPGPDQSRHGRRARRADRALRRLAALLVPALGEPDDGQDATDGLHRAALLVHRDRLAAAGRPARVLDHHEHVDDRPGRDRAQAPRAPAPGGAGRAGGRRRTWRAG